MGVDQALIQAQNDGAELEGGSEVPLSALTITVICRAPLNSNIPRPLAL